MREIVPQSFLPILTLKKNEKLDYKWRIAALPEYINTDFRKLKMVYLRLLSGEKHLFSLFYFNFRNNA